MNYDGMEQAAASPSVLPKPLILGALALAAVAVTVVIAVVIGNKNSGKTTVTTDDSTKKYEFKIPDTVTIGSETIDTGTDFIELTDANLTNISDLSYCQESVSQQQPDHRHLSPIRLPHYSDARFVRQPDF